MRRDLESLKERLSALARHIEETDGVLTEAQVCVLEKKQDDEWLLAKLRQGQSGRWPHLSADLRRYLLQAQLAAASCIRPRPRLQAPIYSITECCLS
jgi:hypothetical protein